MRKLLAFAALSVASALALAAQVEVRFVAPDSYADAERGHDAERTRKLLSEHLIRLGRTRLPSQQSLVVEILDIDLAGERRLGSRPQPETRVLRGQADWPSITLRYTLSEDGRTLRQGQERLTDMNYLKRGSLPAGKGAEPLAYEKRMLDEWFAKRFPK